MATYSFTRARIFQWMGILLALGVIAVSYWYFSVRAGVKLNTSEVQSNGSGRLESGLGLYYAFDEGAGSTVNDLSSNIYDGTTSVTWAAGQIGQAGYFDGSANVSDSDSGPEAIDFTDGEDFTMAAWFNRDTFTSDDAIIARRTGISAANNGYILYIDDATDKLTFEVSDGTDEYQLESVSTFTSTGWHHFAVVWDDTTGAVMYVDGSREAATATGTFSTIDSISTGSGLRIGSSSTATMFYNGWIDEVRIYTWSLSTEDVMHLSRLTGASRPDEDLDGYWSFNAQDMTATLAYDMSGVSNTGTLTNGPIVTPGQLGQALDFDGSDDYVSVPDTENKLDVADTVDLTISGWFNRESFATDDTIAAKRNSITSADAGYILYIDDATDKLTFEVSDGTDEYQLESVSTFTSTGWHHFAIVWDQDSATGSEIYIDGIANSAADTGTIGNIGDLSNTRVIALGAESDAGNPFDGKLDELQIYERVLTAAQIQSLYKQGQSDEVNTSASQPQGTGRLDSGLAGYWKLDDGSGTTATDSSTNGNNGTLTNGPTWTTGQIGGAVNFDGTNDYIDVGTAGLTSPTRLSGAAWINSTVVFGVDHAVFSNRTAGNQGWSLILNSSAACGSANCAYLQFIIQGVASYSTTTALVPSAQWAHIAFSWDGSRVYFYVNGALIESKSTGSMTTGTNMLIGALGPSSSASSYMSGKIDEARIYNRTLSSDEVSQLYRLNSPTGVDTSLKGYWSFNGSDISGTTAYDRSGAGNNGTLTNGPTVTPGKVGQALSFDGTDDKMSFSAFTTGTTFTLSLWVRPNAQIESYGALLIQGTGLQLGLSYRGSAAGSNAGKVSYWDSGGEKLSSTAIADGAWSHIAVVVSAGDLQFYTNSVPNGTASSITSLNLSVMGDNSLSETFKGSIDEVRIYNTALTAAQIQSLYKQGQADEVNTGASQAQGTGRLDSGLAGYWKLDDGSGTSATDSSTNANTGTLTNGPTWTTGQIGGAVDFDGTNDYIDLGSSKTYATTSAPFAISFWMNSDDFSGTNRIPFSFKTDSSNGWSATLLSTVNYTDLSFGKDTASARRFSFPGGFSTSTWYHVAISYNGQGFNTTGNYTAYVNGAPVVINTTGAFNSIDNLNYIGRNRLNGGSGADYWDGRLDEFRFYSRSLSSDEVLDLYRLTSPSGTDTSLKGYWSFNGKDISGTTAYDRSGAGNNGTLTNGPTVTPGKVGQALSFDGTDDYVNVPDSAALSPTSAMTVSFWANVTNVSLQCRTFLAKNTSGGRSWFITTTTSGAVAFYVASNTNDSSTNGTTGGGLVSQNSWVHIVSVFDGSGSDNAGRAKVYVNGVQQLMTFSGTVAATLTDTSQAIRFGESAGGCTALPGSLDEVRIYNTALTAAQIQALYNAGM